ncbi:MAG: exosortase A [Paraglaciecola sp.]|uniref:exosortase A n=1 Tax=Paraglaciecola sp. TaxID=1920173 RepID=UPI003297AD57
MKGGLLVNREQPQFKPVILSLFAILACWVFVFWQGLTTAIDIWLISEIFNHCLFVLPGTAYLIYLKKDQLDLNQLKPNYFVLSLCLGSLLLYAIGLAGDVQLFMHVATFTFLPLVLWAYLGNQLALQILFPLTFILFCIPVGEELIPTLQEITADLSMVMLNWTGIPIYRSGLYIEIPQGRFLVAEACSGISFFIASIVIGSLYSYLNLRSNTRRIGFMLISIVFPVIANAIRVFGIILTGYLSNMEHAVGADHLIYGWIFFSLVIVCLLAIGELIREKLPAKESPQTLVEPSLIATKKIDYKATIIIILVMSLFWTWFKSISLQLNEVTKPDSLRLQTLMQSHAQALRHNWKPDFREPFQESQFQLVIDGQQIDTYMVWYPKGHGELVSSLNRLYSEKSWTLEQSHYFDTEVAQNIAIDTIVNPDSKRLLVHWYLIDGQVFTNKRGAKLFEIYRILMGTYVGSGLVAISYETDSVSEQKDQIKLGKVVRDNMSQFNQYFNFK